MEGTRAIMTVTTTADTIKNILEAEREAGAPPPRKKQKKGAAAAKPPGKPAPTAAAKPPSKPAPTAAAKPPSKPAPTAAPKPPAKLAQNPLSVALSHVAAEVYLRLDADTFKACRPALLRPKPKRLPEAGYSTWKPKGSIFFTLVKAQQDTVVFCHANETAYYAAPAARLASECPDKAAFLCQWCVDKDAKTGVASPRLLVFDLLDSCGGGAAARGERLRGLARCLPQPLCVLQWTGDHKVLEDFVKRGLPHPVDCIVGLSEDDPLRLYRRMRVEIPPPPRLEFVNRE